MAAASPSPAFVMLTGANYLRRAANDAIYATNGLTLLSASLVVDPEVIYATGQDGVIAAKNNAASNQRQWRLTYVATTGIVTITLYDGPTGAAAVVQREASVAITKRSVVTFTYDGGTPELNLYINGALANGALTGVVPATLAASTAVLSIGAEDTSGSPVNVWRGAVYSYALWNFKLSAGDAATLLVDGIVPGALKAGGYAPMVVCEPASIVQVANAIGFSSWTDSVNGWNFGSGAVSGNLPTCIPATGGRLMFSNRWGDSLTDVGDLGLAQGLSSTYTLSPPFRLWGIAASQPQRASYRDGKHDFTVLMRMRRIAGTTDSIFLQVYGVQLQYTLSSKEMFAFVGDDAGANNKRISFGTNLFPVEGITADMVLRYNAAEDEVDFYIGSGIFAKSQSLTASKYVATTLLMADRADFSQVLWVPKCLSDAQVLQLLATVEQSVYAPGTPAFAMSGDNRMQGAMLPQYTLTDAVIIAEVTPVDPDGIPIPAAASTPYSLRITPNIGTSRLGGTLDPYALAEVAADAYLDPDLVIISVVANASHLVTATGQGGVTDSFYTLYWWEVELDPGNDVVATTPQILTTDFFYGRATEVTQFTVPVGQAWAGKRIRMAARPVLGLEQVWYSDWLVLTASEFNNGTTFAIPVYDDPNPAITSITIDDDHVITAVGAAGPATSDLVPFPPLITWWEVEFITGVFVALADSQTVASAPTRYTVNSTFPVPTGVNLQGRTMRLAAHSAYDALEVWYSPPFTMHDPRFDNTGLTQISPASPAPDAQTRATVRPAPPFPGAGVWIKPERDLSSRRRRV